MSRILRKENQNSKYVKYNDLIRQNGGEFQQIFLPKSVEQCYLNKNSLCERDLLCHNLLYYIKIYQFSILFQNCIKKMITIDATQMF
ncbi:hypothetical protein RCL_jg19465.t1 [Rhizophagus clarus]|uniref:Uncharacterized protein n=1 Tax=Rhizophagus clarus TaxID=94130 RepID=A0A8H3LQZ2_9GLOM|nr:hypothetical protein RCL_jg19465.t1 [Rhizophagus clarus]